MIRAIFILVLFLASSVPTALQAQAQVRVVNGLTHHFPVSSGERGVGTVELENTGEESVEVSVYQSDYFFAADVGTVYGEPGSSPRSNAPWVRLGPSPVIVPPGDTVAVSYEFTVPDDANLSGTYWSVIMIEPIPTQDAQAEADAQTPARTLGIAQRLRYAVQVITDVGDTGLPRIVPDQPGLRRGEDGSHTFQVDLANRGTRWVVPAIWIELYSESGTLVGRFEGRKVRIFPDTSVREQIGFGHLAPGRYQAVLIVDGGGNAVFGARYAFAVSEE